MPSSISERDTVDALSEQLHSKNEMEAVTAAYTLAATQQPESVEVLMDALQELPGEKGKIHRVDQNSQVDPAV